MKHQPRKYIKLQQAVLVLAGFGMAISFALGFPNNSDHSISVPPFRLEPIATGLSLFQPGAGNRFYLLSAAQDYVVGKNGDKTFLANWSDGKPSTASSTTFSASVKNEIKITETHRNLPTDSQSIVDVVPNNRDDIVFDTDGVVYTETLPEVLDELTKQTGMTFTLHPLEERTPTLLKTKYLVVVNPDLSGAFAVNTQMYSIIRINKDAKQIELFNAITHYTNPIISTINIKVLRSLEEVSTIQL